MAAAQREALQVYAASGIVPVSATPLPVSVTPYFLELPNWIFNNVAKSMLSIDKEAFSSMVPLPISLFSFSFFPIASVILMFPRCVQYQDLKHKRKTEIDLLNGVVVELGKKTSIPTPINEKIIKLIKEAEQAGQGSPCIKADDLLIALEVC